MPTKKTQVVHLPFNDGTFLTEPTVSWRMLRAIQEENPPPEVWPVLNWFIEESQRRLHRCDYRSIPVRGGLARRCGITGKNANERAAAAAEWLSRGLNLSDGGYVSAILWCHYRRRGTRYYTVPFFWTSVAPHLARHVPCSDRDASEKTL